ncbi:MAG: zinc finger protein [Candidatus Eremiobacteraeota bacterium]|nr:zinc finger protein [Candidatus Eremiobacteraeota bacterium]
MEKRAVCPQCGMVNQSGYKLCARCSSGSAAQWKCRECGFNENSPADQACRKCKVPRYTVREGVWDCLYCGRSRNRGHDKHCSGCGVPRGKDVQFYLAEDAEYVTDETELARAHGGPDWNCPHCGGDNRGGSEFCSGCGAPAEDAPRRKQIIYRDDVDKEGRQLDYVLTAVPGGFEVEALGSTFRGATAGEAFEKLFTRLRKEKKSPEAPGTDEWDTPQAAELTASQAAGRRSFFQQSGALLKEKEKLKNRSVLGKSVTALSILFLVVFLVISGHLMFSPRIKPLTASGMRWERTAEVKVFTTLSESKWADQVPADAFQKKTRTELYEIKKVQTGVSTRTETYTDRVQVGTEKVRTGTQNMGNGYFKDVYRSVPVYKDVQKTRTVQVPHYKDVPVYKEKVTYRVKRWIVTETRKTEGTDDAPFWPAIAVGPKVKEGDRTERYIVSFRGPRNKAYCYQTSREAEWKNFEKGKSYMARIRQNGTIESFENDAAQGGVNKNP